MFLIYINDLPATISSRCFLFVDDCFLLEKVQSPSDCTSKLNHDLTSIFNWAKRWLLTMNETKTESIVFSAKRDKPLHPSLILNNSIIEDVTVHEHLVHLGVTLSSNLYILASAYIKNSSKSFQKIKPPIAIEIYNLSRYTLEVLFQSLVHSSLEYADVVWNRCSESDGNLLESLQIEGARIVTTALKGTTGYLY